MTSLVVVLIVAVLAAWRLTELLVFDEIFLPLREYFGIAHNADGLPLGQMVNNNKLRDFVGRALSCVRCTSVWVGFLVAATVVFLTGLNLIEWGLLALALSQTTILLNNKLTV